MAIGLAGTMQRFVVVGLDHRHAYELTQGLLDAGLECAGYWTGTSDPRVLQGFRERFPGLLAVEDRAALLEDATAGILVCAAIPRDRAGIAIAAMQAGKDVLMDKPGVTTAVDWRRWSAASPPPAASSPSVFPSASWRRRRRWRCG